MSFILFRVIQQSESCLCHTGLRLCGMQLSVSSSKSDQERDFKKQRNSKYLKKTPHSQTHTHARDKYTKNWFANTQILEGANILENSFTNIQLVTGSFSNSNRKNLWQQHTLSHPQGDNLTACFVSFIPISCILFVYNKTPVNIKSTNLPLSPKLPNSCVISCVYIHCQATSWDFVNLLLRAKK